MTARPLIPGNPLTPAHARQLDELIATLSADEALWISGYLAGLALKPESPVATGRVEAPLLILYGSETGHAASLAEGAAEIARARGLPARTVDMADFRLQELAAVRHLIVFTSTYGDGDPPVGAMDFCEFVLGRKAPRLGELKFAVLGLGDSSYERFCQTGKDLDRRLEELGATRIHARADCDVDYEGAAAAWTEAVLTSFAREMEAAAGETLAPVAGAKREESTLRFDEKRPFDAAIIDSLVLNGRGSDKETLHIEISLAGSGLAWEPGDSLGILPENDPALVEEVLALLELRADEPVPAGSGELPLAEALTRHYELTTLVPRFIELYGQAAAAEGLRALAKPGLEADLRSYMGGRQIIDVVAQFPARGLGGKAFVAMLRPLQPRLYSLASSSAAYPDEAHLTVAVVRYDSHGRRRQGVASGYLTDRRGPDDKLRVYINANRNFRLPAQDSMPIIMVGAGTGVAPFRAFLQAREMAGASGRNWLFFGDRRFRTDFLYQTEWQRLLRDGRLTRMDVAFSRDQEEKIYVQHRLLEQGREIYAWLEEGGHFYVCGDASRMAPDVHAALLAIVSREGQMSRERAEEYLKQLQKDRRYQRDVY